MDLTNICCPTCRQPLGPSSGPEGEYACPHCWAPYVVRGGILDFIPRDDFYWGEIDQPSMRRINDQAAQSGDWYGPISRNLAGRPGLIKYITDSSRLGWLFHCYDEHSHRACLDVGSGWGMISFGLSHFYDTVYSLDGVFERLRFQSIRARIDQVENIRLLRSSLLRLPLEDESLDLIALNGVLEWVGLSDPAREPDDLQREFLREVARLLRPGGSIYLGIENRFGLQYFLGQKDHSGLRFTSLVPRPLADRMVRNAALKGERPGAPKKFFHKAQTRYRTYTYSLSGYRSLLKQAGLDSFAPYWAWQSYSYPRMSGTLDSRAIYYAAENLTKSSDRPRQRLALQLLRLLPAFIASRLIRLFAPNFLIVAGRGRSGPGSLQDRILKADPGAKRFVRLLPAPSARLETTYLLLDRHGNLSKSIRVTEADRVPGTDRSFDLEEQGAAGRLIRIHDRQEIGLAARWLADFQQGSRKGRWSDQQLVEEMHELTAVAIGLPGFEDLRLPLQKYETSYINALDSAGLSVVSEQGDFTPLNLLITPQGELSPARWHFSRERGVPLMDIGGFYHALLHHASDGSGSGGHSEQDSPLDWFAQEMGSRMPVPLSITPPYYLLRVIQRVQEQPQSVSFLGSACTELSRQLRLALDHSLSTEDLDP